MYVIRLIVGTLAHIRAPGGMLVVALVGTCLIVGTLAYTGAPGGTLAFGGFLVYRLAGICWVLSIYLASNVVKSSCLSLLSPWYITGVPLASRRATSSSIIHATTDVSPRSCSVLPVLGPSELSIPYEPNRCWLLCSKRGQCLLER